MFPFRTGIIFDVVECLIQRNFSYATSDVRICYRIIKEKLYNPQYTKVVFILHSQGGIEGGLVLDWLLQELPQDLLAKLEVYTFGNAANHFNNPHRHIRSLDRALARPTATAAAHANGRPDPPAEVRANGSGLASACVSQTASAALMSLTIETAAAAPSAVSDRAIGHIEHYAHTTDFVALWGVLHFATSARARHTLPRFIGRLFLRTSERGGHQFCQHYLDGMFPLARDPATKRLVGCAETGNEFMESEILISAEGDATADAREAFDGSWLGELNGEAAERGARERQKEVEVHLTSPVLSRDSSSLKRTVRVKDLSRLWKYRNGKSPSEPPSVLSKDPEGFVMNAAM